MEKYLTWYKEIIKKNGIKNTVQKEAVLNVLIKGIQSSYSRRNLSADYRCKNRSGNCL